MMVWWCIQHGCCKNWSSNTHTNETESSAHLTHCHGHALQLAVGDIIKAIKIMAGSLDAAFEPNKLIKYSSV